MIAPAASAGTLQYTHNLANALVGHGHQVTLATAIDFETKAYPRDYDAIEVFDRFTPRPLRLLRFFRFIRRFKPQIIHMQGAQHPTLYLLLREILGALSDATFVYTPQDVLPNRMRRRHIRMLRLLYSRMQHVFLNAKHNEEQVRNLFGVYGERISVLPMADITAFIRDYIPPVFPETPAGCKLILCFGLIEPRKGIIYLLRAMPAILRAVPEAYLIVVGKAHDDPELYRQEIQKLNIEQSVTFRPEYVSFPEMVGYFSAADVVVLPYESGWNSGVLSSAIGFLKPVVATRVGGFEEVIDDGNTGFLVPPREPEKLANAITRILSDGTLRESILAGVRVAARKHSWKEIARQTSEIYYINAPCDGSRSIQEWRSRS